MNGSVAPRRPQRRVLNPVHPWLRVSEFARLGPHMVGYATDSRGALRLLHFRVPQKSDPLYGALPTGAPWDSEGLLLYYRAPPRTQWDINGLLTQKIELYTRLFNRRSSEWQLRPRDEPLRPDARITQQQLRLGSDQYLADVSLTEQTFSGRGTIGMVRVLSASASFKLEYMRLSEF